MHHTSTKRDASLNRGGSTNRAGSGGKEKWCHFAFDTDDAPAKLHSLSVAAGIPKERAVLSFLLAGGDTQGATPDNRIAVRVISDTFPVQNIGGRLNDHTARFGRYACSAAGSVLITGSAEEMASTPAGTLLRLALPAGEKRDPKSGALIFEPFAFTY
jgi:hypothetical protein